MACLMKAFPWDDESSADETSDWDVGVNRSSYSGDGFKRKKERKRKKKRKKRKG